MSLISQLLDEPFSFPLRRFFVLADWKETPEAHVVKADLPGLKKEEVRLEMIKDRVLQISGEKKEEGGSKNEKWRQVERPRGEFRRRLYLPANVKSDEVKAALENGVLTVIIPKQEIKKPDVKNIEIVG